MTPSQITVKKTSVKTGVHQAVQSGKRVGRVVEEETDEVEEDDELINSQASKDLDVSEVIQNMVKNVSLGFSSVIVHFRTCSLLNWRRMVSLSL